MNYYAAAQRAARARAAALARQARLLKKAKTAVARLNAADRAYQEGDIPVATRIYVSLARAALRPVAFEARKRLIRLEGEAREKLQAIQDDFAAQTDNLSPGDSSYMSVWTEKVTAMFKEYDSLSDQYGDVPAIKTELKNHIAKERRFPLYARVLNEPDAKVLWDSAQQHEQLDQLCCAYWVYREAAKLTPAASALRAKNRLDELQEDSQVVTAAERCRDIQLCHKMYKSAESIIHTKPERARDLFKRIFARAPQDSELYRAARQHLIEL